MDNSKDINDIVIEEDSGSYSSGKDGLSFRSIILTHFKNCIMEGSREMVTGGVQVRYIDGQRIESIAPNQIEIFMNHVDSLQTALSADIPVDPNIVNLMKGVEEKKQEMKDKFNKAMSIIRKRYSQISNIRNPNDPNSTSTREKIRPRYNAELKRLQEKFIRSKLLVYKEEILPTLTTLISLRYKEE